MRMVMDDIVLLEDQVNPVMSAALDNFAGSDDNKAALDKTKHIPPGAP